MQIDERCNLHCAHCFVSATRAGQSMPYDDITSLLIPRLTACRVERATLTGGEPTIHPQFTEIVRALRGAGMQVGFCTNATTLTDAQISELAGIGGVHANVCPAQELAVLDRHQLRLGRCFAHRQAATRSAAKLS